MTNRDLNKHIAIRKNFLNFLLKYFSPTNYFIVFLSQNLDTLISKSQKSIYNKHKRKKSNYNYLKKSFKINKLKKIA